MMRALLGLLVWGHLCSASAQELAYLIRRTQNLRTHQEFLCEIFPHRIDLIEYQDNRYLYRKTKDQSFDSKLMDFIVRAEAGPIVQTRYSGESSIKIRYYGHYVDDEGLHEVPLKTLSDELLINQSQEAITLISYLDSLCDSF